MVNNDGASASEGASANEGSTNTSKKFVISYLAEQLLQLHNYEKERIKAKIEELLKE